MKTTIAILTSPKHRRWSDLTQASIGVFWPHPPAVRVYGDADDRDWLSTALSMAQELKQDGVEVVHFLLADHALAGAVNPAKVEAAVSALKRFGAVSYRNHPHLQPAGIVPSPQHNFCLCPGVWRVDTLVEVLTHLDGLLTDTDQRTPANVDRLFHCGVVGNTGAITGQHNTLPMPVFGCLLQGQLYLGYELFYQTYPELLDMFRAAQEPIS